MPQGALFGLVDTAALVLLMLPDIQSQLKVPHTEVRPMEAPFTVALLRMVVPLHMVLVVPLHMVHMALVVL
jgi:hypothetical protein